MSPSLVTWLVFAATVLAAAVATWAACRIAWGRKLAAAAQRLRKSDEARGFAQQQAQQARRQIETLQKELAAERARRPAGRGHDDPRAALEASLRRDEASDPPSTPMPLERSGFADTQILS